jgi:hypothetical protein
MEWKETRTHVRNRSEKKPAMRLSLTRNILHGSTQAACQRNGLLKLRGINTISFDHERTIHVLVFWKYHETLAVPATAGQEYDAPSAC